MNAAIVFVWMFFMLILFVSIKYNLHRDGRYVQGIQLFMGLNVLLTTYIILVQINNHTEEVKNENTTFVNMLIGYENDILEEFMKYPNMKYFFNELYNNEESSDNYNRDVYLEQIISYKIISFISFHSVYYFSHYKLPTFSELLIKQHKRVVKLIKGFMQSPIFVSYIKMYLNRYGGENLERFFTYNNITLHNRNSTN